MESLQSRQGLAMKVLADVASKYTLDPQFQEESTLSNDLSRSSGGAKFISSKPPLSDSDSNMLDELSDGEDDNDDDSDRLFKSITNIIILLPLHLERRRTAMRLSLR